MQLEKMVLKILRHEYSTFVRTRMQVTSDAGLHGPDAILGLNEFFLGPELANTTLVYKFRGSLGESDSELGHDEACGEWKYLKSSGCLIYTGTGSTAWAQSVNQLSFAAFSRLVRQVHPAQQSRAEIETLYSKFRSSHIFEHDCPELRFVHRELFHGKGPFPAV